MNRHKKFYYPFLFHDAAHQLQITSTTQRTEVVLVIFMFQFFYVYNCE